MVETDKELCPIQWEQRQGRVADPLAGLFQCPFFLRGVILGHGGEQHWRTMAGGAGREREGKKRKKRERERI